MIVDLSLTSVLQLSFVPPRKNSSESKRLLVYLTGDRVSRGNLCYYKFDVNRRPERQTTMPRVCVEGKTEPLIPCAHPPGDCTFKRLFSFVCFFYAEMNNKKTRKGYRRVRQICHYSPSILKTRQKKNKRMKRLDLFLAQKVCCSKMAKKRRINRTCRLLSSSWPYVYTFR